ncbi:MAG TPA: DNA-formamidopyrimidine glycosylase family protein [Candidatus Dormibacteraeota bacterium]|nr:DNA-formamidopyrimidine glycosylase family protein [Candidatus Dormibacteraeota bacterium]
MPELPELEVLCEYFQPRLAGRSIDKVAVSPRFGFLLRTPPADLAAKLEGKTISRIWRRGKFMTLDVGERHLVINPMLGGRLHWATKGTKAPASLFSLRLSSGDTLSLTDFARMARVYLVEGDRHDAVPGWEDLGPEANQVGAEEFAQRIRRHPGELKNLLRNQAFVAGIGNAYSDEILHEARMLPLRKRSTLQPGEVLALHAAVGKVLAGATAAIASQPHYEPHKQDRSFMRVHMRGGQPCPRCGHRIAELTARGEITDYCRGCQK